MSQFSIFSILNCDQGSNASNYAKTCGHHVYVVYCPQRKGNTMLIYNKDKLNTHAWWLLCSQVLLFSRLIPRLRAHVCSYIATSETGPCYSFVALSQRRKGSVSKISKTSRFPTSGPHDGTTTEKRNHCSAREAYRVRQFITIILIYFEKNLARYKIFANYIFVCIVSFALVLSILRYLHFCALIFFKFISFECRLY